MSQEILRSRAQGRWRKETGFQGFLSGSQHIPCALGSLPGRLVTSLSTLCSVDASITITPEVIYAKSQALYMSADCRLGW